MSDRDQLGLILVVVLLLSYWTASAVVVAHNVSHRQPHTITITTAPNAEPVIAHIEEDPHG